MDNNMINNMKKLIYDKLKYTNQDFESIMREMIKIVREEDLPTKWNNLSETDPIVMLFALFAAHKDILHYMLDYRIGETYMSTARERASMVRIANSYGYKIPSYEAGAATYTLNTAYLKNNLESFTIFLDENGVPWTYIGELVEKNKGIKNIILYQGSPETFPVNMISDYDKTRVIPFDNIAFYNTYDDTDMVELTYETTKFRYEDLSQPFDNKVETFELNIDPLGHTYIKFNEALDLGKYPKDFTFKCLITRGGDPVIPQTTISLGEYGEEDKVLTIVDGSFIKGRNPAEPEEIKEGFKKYYAGLNSLVTVKDYANYIMNVQKAVPNINKCLVLDSQTDSAGGSGDSDISSFTVVIYVTKEDSEGNTKILTAKDDEEKEDEDIDKLIKDLALHKITGIEILVNGGTNTPGELSTEEISIIIDGNITDDMTAAIYQTIKKTLQDANIGELLTVNKIVQDLSNKGLLKYFEFGANILFEQQPDDKSGLSYQLPKNKYVGTVKINNEVINGEE